MERIATRDAYGKELVELGKISDKLFVLDADLSEATRTSKFRDVFPERFIECGIAEANMMGVAAGLAATGKIPFVSTFAMFAAERAFEQIRNSIAYPKLNVKIAATHGGITVGEDGATHQCLEDLAIMRDIPGMTVINPADAIEAKLAVRAAFEMTGPVYLRFGRYAVPVIYDKEYDFKIGKGVLLREGKDVTIVATGFMVSIALEAAELLRDEGIDAEVINIHTIKPLDSEILVGSAKKTGCMVTAEEHSIIGGLGSAVCELMSEQYPVPVLRVGTNDRFGKSGKVVPLLEKYGLTKEHIVIECLKAVRSKRI